MSDALSEARAEAEGHAKALPKRILLATDGSEDAALAARAAVDLAIGADAELHVAHAWQAVPTTRFDAFVRARLLAEARELLEAQVALLGEAGGIPMQMPAGAGGFLLPRLISDELHLYADLLGARSASGTREGIR